jgi:transcriptional accessory protein Tex/SPT6
MNEDGASCLFSSETAREEFRSMLPCVPRWVIRRLMDPLAELVKIDPKSIGAALEVPAWCECILGLKRKLGLDQQLWSCVNNVESNPNARQQTFIELA